MSLRTTSISPDLIPASLREKGYTQVAYITAAFIRSGLTREAARSYTSQYLRGTARQYILKRVATFQPIEPGMIVASSSHLTPSTAPHIRNRLKSSEPKKVAQAKKEKAPTAKTNPQAKTVNAVTRVTISGAGSEVTTSKANVRASKKNEETPKPPKPVSTEIALPSPRMLTTEESYALAAAELERECARFERILHTARLGERPEEQNFSLVLISSTTSSNEIEEDIFSIRIEDCAPRFRFAARDAGIDTLGEVIDACTENGMSLNSAIVTAKDIASGNIYKSDSRHLTARAAFALAVIKKKPSTPLLRLQNHHPAGQVLGS